MFIEREVESDCSGRIDGGTWEVVSEFVYLGVMIVKSGECMKKAKKLYHRELKLKVY